MRCRNKEVLVEGLRFDDAECKMSRNKLLVASVKLRCIISNDERGKTLSIDDGRVQYTIPFEKIERYLK